jgi:hypothetical protein
MQNSLCLKRHWTPHMSMHKGAKTLSWPLVVQAIIFFGMGVYFILLRPSLLPEDYAFLKTSQADLEHKLALLPDWLSKVFTVMGGFMISNGILLAYIANQELTKRLTLILLLAALSSIGLMTAVNFLINSDFKWLLLLFNLPVFYIVLTNLRVRKA